MMETEHISARTRNMEDCGYPYKFSVVIPVYNTEQYLEETVSSVLNQTIGFEENIQLILVNNATEDAAGEICKHFREMYPNNVIYVELAKNSGPSGARNEGKKFVTGKYINFMDSDDKWDKAAFERVWEFFNHCGERIDCLACRMKMFDANNSWHALDYRFKKSRIVNVNDEYDALQLHVNTTFIYVEAIKDHWFDIEMNHAEDTKFINLLILETGRYALLREALYFYRKRVGDNSLLVEVQKQEKYYSTDLKKSLGFFIEYSIKKYEKVIPYIQYMVMYTLKWRIKEKIKCVLSAEAEKKYFNLISQYLKYVEDYIILEQKGLNREHKVFALSLARKSSINDQLIYRDKAFRYKNFEIFKENESSIIAVIIIDIGFKGLQIEGRVNLPIPQENYRLYIQDNEKRQYDIAFFELDSSAQKICAGHVYQRAIGFKVCIPHKDMKTLAFYMDYHGYQVGPMGMGFWFVTKLTKQLKSSYFSQNGILITYRHNVLYLERSTFIGRWKCELNILKELLKNKNMKTIGWRLLISFGKCIANHIKPIWIIMDGFGVANDNAEALFQYLMKQDNLKVHPFFVVSNKYPDYHRLKKIGPVIPADSKFYRLMFSLSDKVISSQSFYNSMNTFYNRTEQLQDLFHFDFIYLQHGVIKDNHADTQSKHKKNFSMFITSAQKEKDSIVQGIGGNYCYDESVVKLTGLARHDALLYLDPTKKKKKLLLAPTWRKEGVGPWCEQKQTYLYSETFKDTAFYKFYQSLMSDTRILNAMEIHGYHMTVRLHPRTMQQACDFQVNRLINLEMKPSGYVEEIEETSLLITDYSSIAFDYAYAHIPVIYTQFDVDTFYLNHGYKRGYFEYDTDGFGPVCYDYESTVQAIINAIEKDCIMEDRYKQRVDSFFAYRDGKNCERIYQEILKMDEVKENE